ncbi:DNA polymerase IV [Anaeroselena agilis]|uniref:DNA polymerase IV n=1 Tax=Anaeroselena agilis TaxID=3063788 RepID=A0ABU3P1V1_9FIRM|nr:DNA polymerase IV [Selenomonadales bacterium 4137-cl]
MQRWIIHVDMDAFFAAVEQRDDPALRGRPVVVGGVGPRGVVSTASYEARRFGVHSAMPMSEARRLCPHAVFMPGDHRKYTRVAGEIRAILAAFSPLVEPLSLDEAFLDASGMEWLYKDPKDIAAAIKAKIRDELALTASAGVAPNKFLAKLASDWGKPDGLVVVRHDEIAAFLRAMPVSRLWGAGEKTVALLKGIGINTIGQLADADEVILRRHFGQQAGEMRRLARGEDDRPVVPEHEPKSIGNEVTFDEDLRSRDDIGTCLLALSQKVGRRLRQAGYAGRTVTVKIRFGSFRTITRSRTLGEATLLGDTIYETAQAIMADIELAEGVRLLGVTLSNLQVYGSQTSLFATDDDKKLKASVAVDHLKDKFGEGAITRGRLMPKKEK